MLKSVHAVLTLDGLTDQLSGRRIAGKKGDSNTQEYILFHQQDHWTETYVVTTAVSQSLPSSDVLGDTPIIQKQVC